MLPLEKVLTAVEGLIEELEYILGSMNDVMSGKVLCPHGTHSGKHVLADRQYLYPAGHLSEHLLIYRKESLPYNIKHEPG